MGERKRELGGGGELGGERKRDDRLTGRAASYVAVNARVAPPKPLIVGQNSLTPA